jgi:hypothetical protein
VESVISPMWIPPISAPKAPAIGLTDICFQDLIDVSIGNAYQISLDSATRFFPNRRTLFFRPEPFSMEAFEATSQASRRDDITKTIIFRRIHRQQQRFLTQNSLGIAR